MTSRALNRDTFVALFLLLACGGLMVASFEIREPDYGQLSPAVWPRVILGVMAFLSLIYLVKSIRHGSAESDGGEAPAEWSGFAGFFSYWRNVIWVFVLFAAYLVALPWVGMLIGGSLFVFVLLNALGGWSARHLTLHAAIAAVAVGGMWLLFTHGLGVLLPRGELTGL